MEDDVSYSYTNRLLNYLGLERPGIPAEPNISHYVSHS